METLYDFFAKPTDPKRYTGFQVSLASPEQIKEWSYGEIKKPETINYRTFKPERDGLFCAKIFGPAKDYECNCGKYKRMKHRGVVCEKCGVEVIQSKVRRERMGHIELAAPVSHIWFLKSLPSKIGNLLNIALKNLERILYFDSYVVIDGRDSGLKKYELLSDGEYRDAIEMYGYNSFEALMGAEAIKTLLSTLDLDEACDQVREAVYATGSVAKRQKLYKRLKVIESFRISGLDPAWMIMDVVPVLPPDLRPLVPLEGGRFATSDLNDLYRRVINRNNRLKRLMDLKAPEIIIRNEKRMLQESVDVLFDNGRHGRVITGTNKRPLKSLSDTLKGKQGRFRQNLLGKRVDYSGRTVITVGPRLRIHQCGLPKKMALELFKPFLYYKLEQAGLVSTVKGAKKLVEQEVPEVWDILDDVVKEYPIMLNRAPTLHRLGIQAFEPILIEGKAIQLHPLVCTAFNADFDGDQMAVHIPLSIEAQIEARVLMLSSNNILSPANGEPIIVPSQDIVLGIYYMTRENKRSRGAGKIFSNSEEVIVAYDAGAVDLHSAITVRIDGERIITTVGRILLWEIMPKGNLTSFKFLKFRDKIEAQAVQYKLAVDDRIFGLMDLDLENVSLKDIEQTGFIGEDEFQRTFDIDKEFMKDLHNLNENEISSVIRSGKDFYIFEVIARRPEIPFTIINRVMNKNALREVIDYVYRNFGPKITVILADRLKDIGYEYSTQGGLSISIGAMLIPHKKEEIIVNAELSVSEMEHQYSEGLITQGEKYNKVIDIWAKATDDVADEMMKVMKIEPVLDSFGRKMTDENREIVTTESFNPIYMMAHSGARGSKDQMRQLAGMRGLMAKPSGEIIETPIQANFREGLSVLQYFISTHGARKGLADTALKTANSGYLTRRLADVAHDCTVIEADCGSLDGIRVESLLEGGEIIQRLGERILGRVVVEDILDPFTDKILISSGKELNESDVVLIEEAGVTSVVIRSVLTCDSKRGVCARCYGRDLSYGKRVEIGQAVGILAAQSIGEPGTQLTMRTFHIGGTASRRVEQADIRVRGGGNIKFIDLKIVKNAENQHIAMNRKGGELSIVSKSGREKERYPIIYGAHVLVKDGQEVKANDLLASWDPFTTPIITEVDGMVKFGDLFIGKTLQEKVDPVTGKSSRTVIESKTSEERPRISIKGEDGKTANLPNDSNVARYMLPVDAILLVNESDFVKAGDIIAKLPRATTKTKDITGGLPRVAELFEVRKPKEVAVLSEIDGYISIAKATKKGKQRITVIPPDVGDKKEYLIPRGKHINVYEGDYVRAGEALIGGAANPQDVLKIKGEVSLAKYLVDEVQEVYRLQGVRINDKHIEVIVRQMMRRVKIIEVGDTNFVVEEITDRVKFEEVNEAVIQEGRHPAAAEPLILGITKASLSTSSFVSAASFQETTKVLTDASILGAIDNLRGLKENVIMGRIIPAGTGIDKYKGIDVERC